MTNSKITKRTLIISVISLILCVAVLIVTTFAWFADTANTSVDKIKTGTLKVALMCADNATGTEENTQWTETTKETVLGFLKDSDNNADIIWEPGASYSLPALKIKNNGDLAFKYQVQFSLVTSSTTDVADEGNAGENTEEKADLAEVLQITIKNGSNEEESKKLKDILYSPSSNNYCIEGKLGASKESDVITLSVKMPEEGIDAKYQGLTIKGIAINVLAAQDTVEYDSTQKKYDEKAVFPVIDNAQLSAAITAAATQGGIVAISEGNFELPTNNSDTTTGNSTADLSGNNITISGEGADSTTLDLTKTDYKIEGENLTVSDVTIKGTSGEVENGTSVMKLSGNNTTLSGVKVDGSKTTTTISNQYSAQTPFIQIDTIAEGKTVTIEDSELITGTWYGLKVDTLNGTLLIKNSTLTALHASLTIGGGTGKLVVTDSTLADVVEIDNQSIGSATFTRCTFKKANQNCSKADIRCNVTFTDCKFENGFTYDSHEIGITVTFNGNCTYDGQALTEDIIRSKIFSNSSQNANVTVKLNGTEVSLNKS